MLSPPFCLLSLSDGRPAPGATADNLVYFLQASDIHLSVFHPERQSQFESFCNQTVKVVAPAMTILTGDITDAMKTPAGSGVYYQNQQQEEEWRQYRQTLVANGLFNKSLWLDIRGNHDAYAVAEYNSTGNYYLTYGVYGDQRDYTYVLQTGFARYQFVSMDLSYDLGLSAPFDFFGLVPQEIDRVKAAVDEAPLFNHTLLFGHYPRATSMNRIPWEYITKDKILAYLCGHLHTARMYSPMPEDYHELELEVRALPVTISLSFASAKLFSSSFFFFPTNPHHHHIHPVPN